MKTKVLIPKTTVSVNSEIEQLRNKLAQGEQLTFGDDGSIISAKADSFGANRKERKTPHVPHGTLGASEQNGSSVRDMINQMRGETPNPEQSSDTKEEADPKKSQIKMPHTILGSE